MIPLGALTLVAGIGGLGKSTWLMNVAAGVTNGTLGDPVAC
jgi:excinuclease UvrABC ATPase subunit